MSISNPSGKIEIVRNIQISLTIYAKYNIIAFLFFFDFQIDKMVLSEIKLFKSSQNHLKLY